MKSSQIIVDSSDVRLITCYADQQSTPDVTQFNQLILNCIPVENQMIYKKISYALQFAEYLQLDANRLDCILWF